MLQVLSIITPMVARYTRIEALYIHKQKWILVRNFEKVLTDLYASILKINLEMVHFYKSSSAKRVRDAVMGRHDWKGMLADVKTRDEICLGFTNIFDAENADARHAELHTLVWEQQEVMDRTLKFLQANHNHVQQEANDAVIEWISKINPGDDHGSILDRTKTDTVFRTSGQWLLGRSQYHAWTEATHEAESVLSIEGYIGTGKTSLMSLIIENMLERSNLANGQQVAFFYCSKSHGKQDGSPTKDILRGLLRQLAFGEDGLYLLEPIEYAYKQARMHGGLQQYLTDQLCLDLLQSCVTIHGTVYIIIDALDESAGWEDVLEELGKIRYGTLGTVKLCFSSRPEVVVSSRFPDVLSVDVGESDTQADLRAFVEYAVTSRGSPLLKDPEGGLEKALINALCDGAQGMCASSSLAEHMS